MSEIWSWGSDWNSWINRDQNRAARWSRQREDDTQLILESCEDEGELAVEGGQGETCQSFNPSHCRMWNSQQYLSYKHLTKGGNCSTFQYAVISLPKTRKETMTLIMLRFCFFTFNALQLFLWGQDVMIIFFNFSRAFNKFQPAHMYKSLQKTQIWRIKTQWSN